MGFSPNAGEPREGGIAKVLRDPEESSGEIAHQRPLGERAAEELDALYEKVQDEGNERTTAAIEGERAVVYVENVESGGLRWFPISSTLGQQGGIAHRGGYEAALPICCPTYLSGSTPSASSCSMARSQSASA